MPKPMGYVCDRRRTKEEMVRIFYLILRDELDADAIAERWGTGMPTAKTWRQEAINGQRRAERRRLAEAKPG